MPHAFKASEIERRAHDGGQSARARRWFSSSTVAASDHYRDLKWSRLALHGGGALMLVLASRIDPTWGAAPWMLLAGVGWSIWAARAAIMKLIDQQS